MAREIAEHFECPIGETDLCICNLDQSIDEGLADVLTDENVHAHHFAWDFCGDVYWDGLQFIENVNRYHVRVDTIKAPTLSQLMDDVNAKYGSD